jgi:hypothetical protein
VGAELWEVEGKAGPNLTVMWGTDVDDFDPETQVGALGRESQAGVWHGGVCGFLTLGRGVQSWPVARGCDCGVLKYGSSSSTSTKGGSGASRRSKDGSEVSLCV